jgi:4-amino-4-deoxy-L-arabinose transferase-like glycosyltransferase
MTISEEPRDTLALFGAPFSVWRASRRLLFALALFLRLFFVLFLHSPRDYVFSDMQSYDSVALELLTGQITVWHAFRPVGYSFLLAFVYALTDVSRTFVGVLQALMGAALAIWTADLARAAGIGRAFALLAGLLVATSVPLILYCGLLLTEIPSAFFLVLALKLLMVPARARGESGAERAEPSSISYGRLLRAGLCLGLAGAVRPNFLLVYAVVPAYLLYVIRARWPGERARQLVAWALLALGLAAPLAVVCAHNSRALGRPTGPSANGGLNFYLNFADVHTIHYQGRFGQYWIAPVPNGFDHTRQELTEVPLYEDAHYYARGLAYVRAHPESLGEALQNFPEAAGIGRQLMWPHWPGHEQLLHVYALGFFALVLVPGLLALGVLGLRGYRLLRARSLAGSQAPEGTPEALTIGALCASSALPIYLFLGDPRVRVPFDPLWILLAAFALHSLGALIRARSRPPAQEAVSPK